MIKIVNNIKKANLITHSGSFHADDVFATALMSKIIKNPKVFRINNFDDSIKTDAIVYDIGGGKFDHHQKDSEYRKGDLIKYSSIGLLWREFGLDYIKKITNHDPMVIFQKIDEGLILQIDAIDNGIFPIIEADYRVKTLSDVIAMLNPTWDKQDELNDRFKEAVNLAEKILDLEIDKVISKLDAKDKVNDAINNVDDGILILDKFMPFKDFILDSEKGENIKFVITPSQREGYTVHTVPISKDNREPRIKFKKSWGGLRQKELQEKSKVETAIFVHPDLFIGGAYNLEDAIKLAQLAINNNSK